MRNVVTMPRSKYKPLFQISYWEGKALKKSEGVKIRTSLLTVGPRVIQSTRMQAMILLTMGCKKKKITLPVQLMQPEKFQSLAPNILFLKKFSVFTFL